MKFLVVLLILGCLAGCTQSFTVYPAKDRGNERPLVYDSSDIPTLFNSDSSSMELQIALHSREFPNGIMWTMSVAAPHKIILPQKMFAYQDNKIYELIRLQSDHSIPSQAYYVLPPNFLNECRFSDKLTLELAIGDETFAKVSDKEYLENFGMFYSFVNLDTKRNTSILFIH